MHRVGGTSPARRPPSGLLYVPRDTIDRKLIKLTRQRIWFWVGKAASLKRLENKEKKHNKLYVAFNQIK